MISHFYQRKGKLETKEDSLTSLTFDGLKHLPDDLFWSVLNSSLIVGNLPNITFIEEISFWQHWNPDGTDNKNYIEPDVFLRTENFDVIIEAKRWDKNQQSESQMEDQIKAYNNEFGEENKKLYYIQLGGLYDKKPAKSVNESVDVTVCKTNWTQFLKSIVKHHLNLESQNSQFLNPQKRILEDIIKGFELHQFYTMKWFGDMPYQKINFTLFDFCKFTTDSIDTRLFRPLKNLTKTTILNTTTNNLFQYARQTQ